MGSTFTKIGSYLYSYEAVIVKGRLEAYGVQVFMVDNFIIDTDPLISNATGGVKLFVKTEQLNFAKQILSEISPYSLDDRGKSIICPECGENKVRLETTVKEKRSLLAFLFGFFVAGGLPVYVKYKYRCMSCDKEFNI